jgi:hypothetical protein
MSTHENRVARLGAGREAEHCASSQEILVAYKASEAKVEAIT